MIARSTKIAVEVLIALLAGLALLAGMALWRLSSGPVQLGFLTPYLEETFANSESGLTIEIGETLLLWEGWAHTLDIRARDVRLRNPDSSLVAAFPDVAVTLSLKALLRGTVAPTEIEVVDARVRLLREPDGHFELAMQEGAEGAAEDEPDFSAVLPELIDLFLRKADRDNPLSYLTAVRVVDGQLSVLDRRLKALWLAPEANMELRRHPRGIAAHLGLKVAIGEAAADANIAVLFDAPRQQLTLTGRFSDFRPDALAAVLPLPDALAGFEVPLEAGLRAELTPEGLLKKAHFDITGAAGVLSLPSVLPTAQPVAGLNVRGTFDGRARRLEIEAAQLRFGSAEAPGPTLALSAVAEAGGADTEITGSLRIDNLPADRLAEFWPLDAAPGGRAWTVANIEGGVADDGRLDFALRLPGGDPEAVELSDLSGGFAFRDLSVHYLRPMPPITGASGRALVDGDSLKFQVAAGRVGDLLLSDARIAILNLHGDASMEIEGTVAGPVRQALALLDHDRLKLLARMGLDPQSASGESVALLAFTFPLLDDLSFEQIALMARGEIRHGALAGFLLGRDASDMNLTLDLDGRGMAVSGNLALADNPATIDWREAFTPDQPVRTYLELDFPRLDAAGRARLGLDLAPYVEGPLSARVAASLGQDGAGSVKIAANLQDTALALPFLNWRKPQAVSGALRLTLTLADQEIVALEDFEVEAGTLLARGQASLLSGGRDFSRIQFDRLAFGGTTLEQVALLREGDGLLIDLGQGVLDAGAFLTNETPEEPGEAAAPGAQPPLQITGRGLSAVYFAEGRYLKGVELQLERRADGWERVALSGRIPQEFWRHREKSGKSAPAAAGGAEGEAETAGEAKTFALNFGPSGMGDYRLTVQMNDMGAGLRALDVLDTVEGGKLIITGISAGPAPAHPIAGHIEAKDYMLKDAPVMAQLLSLASFTGIANVLTGEGIAFDRLVGDFTLEDGVVRSDLMRAYGGALGLTAKGTLDFASDKVDLHGTVVPAYTVNRILGYIPVLGNILTGGEGEGVLAVTYAIDGRLSEPKVSVNPLSVLTPGFLRNVFELGRGNGAEEGSEARPLAVPKAADR